VIPLKQFLMTSKVKCSEHALINNQTSLLMQIFAKPKLKIFKKYHRLKRRWNMILCKFFPFQFEISIKAVFGCKAKARKVNEKSFPCHAIQLLPAPPPFAIFGRYYMLRDSRKNFLVSNFLLLFNDKKSFISASIFYYSNFFSFVIKKRKEVELKKSSFSEKRILSGR